MSTSRQTVLFYWRHAWQYPRYVIGMLISLPLTVLFNSFLPPLILASVLGRLSSGDFQPHHAWASFGPSLILYAILVISSSIVAWRIVDYFAWKLEANVERDIAQQVFDHLISQSANFHANHFTGSLVSQTNKLMGGYIRVSDTTVFQVLPLIMSLVFTTAILAHRAALFVIVLMIFAAFYIVSSIFVTRPVRKLSAKHAASESEQTGYLADSVTNAMAVKSFSRGTYESRNFAIRTDGTRNSLAAFMNGHAKQQIYFGSVTGLISALSLALAVIIVVVYKGNIATAFLIFNYTSSIVNQLFTFSNNSLRNYNRSMGDASDMVKILQIEPEIQDPKRPEKLRIKKGKIEFDHVDFAHQGSDDDPLFHDLNFSIAAGEKVGLVGHSGSGKTTFTRLLMRFSDIDSGQILIDGQDIARITQDDLHGQIAYVPQEPLLFHRTIRENIAYGKANSTDKEIFTAALRANATEFIEKLPQGYETLVGERGVKLSGGQRQRIAIARAMLKNAPILLLDEATSALDSESEVLIQDALWKLMEGRSAIVIAHRLSTIQHMDRIIVLDDGSIVEQGSHKELLRNKGTYAKLWAHQSGGFMED